MIIVILCSIDGNLLTEVDPALELLPQLKSMCSFVSHMCPLPIVILSVLFN